LQSISSNATIILHYSNTPKYTQSAAKSAVSSLQQATGFMDKWVINLRQNLKEDAHIGFSVNQKSGKVEPTHRINGAYKRNAPEVL